MERLKQYVLAIVRLSMWSLRAYFSRRPHSGSTRGKSKSYFLAFEIFVDTTFGHFLDNF